MPWANIEWRGPLPWSPLFGDGYFGSEDPRAEIESVFFTGNSLANRFPQAQRFVIGETGFGSGLNFIATLGLWRKLAPPGSFLSYVSTEAYPLRPEDIRKILAAHEAAESDIQALLQQYPPPISGFHRIYFRNDRVVLTLLLGDAAPALAQLRGKIDAWFLDGFAPARNPALWNLAVFQQMARLSGPDATLGTFSVAGQVRRDLTEAGFTVWKCPGHGGKRERLEGRIGTSSGISFPVPADASQVTPGTVTVIGAGIAGLSVASALQDRGCKVLVIDSGGVGSGASGNPAALLTPPLRAGDCLTNALSRAGMREARSLLLDLAKTEPQCLRSSGVKHYGMTQHARRRLERLLQEQRNPQNGVHPCEMQDLFREEAESLAERPALFYPQALAVNLKTVCQTLAATLNLQMATVVGYHHDPDQPQAPHLLTLQDGSEIRSTWIVVATGVAPPIAGLDWESPQRVGGQMSLFHPPLQPRLPHAVTGKGHCFVAENGTQWIGATYRHSRTGHTTGCRAEDDQSNLAQLAWLQEEFSATAPGNHTSPPAVVPICEQSWFGERAVFPSRLPRIGPLGQAAGLFLCLGFASRGVLYAPLAGQLLADRLLGLPEPLPHQLAELLDIPPPPAVIS